MQQNTVVGFLVIVMLLIAGCDENAINYDKEYEKQKEQISGKNIAVIEGFDLDEDSVDDEVKLLLDDSLNVILFVNDSFINVFNIENERQIFGENPQDQYIFDLRASNNKIIVGKTYTFANKYGSTASLDFFEYSSNTIKKIWSLPDGNSVIFSVVDYIVKENTIVLKTSLGNKNIVLSDKEKNNYEMFSSYLKETGSLPVFEYTTMPEYRIVDNKSNIEIVTRGIVTCGACPVTQVYYQKYYLSDDGFDEKECWFESGNPLLADEYGF